MRRVQGCSQKIHQFAGEFSNVAAKELRQFCRRILVGGIQKWSLTAGEVSRVAPEKLVYHAREVSRVAAKNCRQ
jgi:hypothetical protein